MAYKFNPFTAKLDYYLPAGSIDHSALLNLTYASAGHTGFEPTVAKGNLTEITSSVLTITGGTGAVIGTGTSILVKLATAIQSGYLSSGDWTTFNGKENVITFSAPLSRAVNTVSIPVATSLANGYLSSADWTTFNNKQNALSFGNLTTTTTGLAITGGTGSVIGTGATINADTGYGIPTTVQIGNWNTAYGWGNHAGLYLKLDQTTPESVINGRPTFVQGLLLGTSPTVGTFAEGKLYYNATKKTLNAEIDTNITLAIGEQEYAYCYNAGAEIPKGSLVYPTGATGNTPSVALAQADTEATSLVLGVTAQVISSLGSGFVLVRGILDGVDTSHFAAGETLYLDPAVAGGFTHDVPTTGQYLVRVGVCLISNATTGSIYIRPILKNRLSDLADVVLATPATDQILRYNGVEWVNSAGIAASASKGVGFYYDGTEIIATGNDNSNLVETLARVPWVAAESVESTAVNNSTVLADIYLYDTALSRVTLEAGAWIFSCYCAVNLAAGVSEILHNVARVRPGTGTVTITGSGTSRTATASTGTPFAAASIDVGGTIDSDSYLRTPLGVYRITARTNDTVVTITTPSTYSNESAVAYSVHKRLFQVTTGEIDNTASAPLYAGIQLYTINSVQPAYTIALTDKLAIYRFAKTTSSVTKYLYFAYGGTTRYSRVDSPLATLHGDLAGLQGGTGAVPAEQYYHLTLAQHTVATQAGTASVNGYIASADWTTFNSKQAGHANLTSLAGLSYVSTSFVKMTGADTFTLDTNTYLTSVTAHNVLSATHGDALADSVIQGDVMVGNATPKWARLAANATGTKKYLQSVSGGVSTWEQVDYADLSGSAPSGALTEQFAWYFA